jgi:hypothetical protein
LLLLPASEQIIAHNNYYYYRMGRWASDSERAALGLPPRDWWTEIARVSG